MTDNPNIIIEQRLKNIENRIGRLAFLLTHLKKFKEDRAQIDDPSRVLDGAFLFYFYSFSQFILEINKLFDDANKEYYTLPKLLNHIESNIKKVEWYKSEVTYPEPTNKQHASGKNIWSKGETKEWSEPAKGKELIKRQELICDLKLKILESQEELDKVRLARDKVIAHLDKDFQKLDFTIELEMTEGLFLLAHEIFNMLNKQIKGRDFRIEHTQSDTLSTIIPIKKYYQIQSRLIKTNLTHEKTIPVEELKKIIFSNTNND